jgi:hypothetical protein
MRVARHGWSRRTAAVALVTSALLGSAARAADDAPIAPQSLPPVPALVTHPESTDSVDWTASVAVGPVIAVLADTTGHLAPPAFGLKSTAWQVELQRRSNNRSFLLGVTLEGTHDQTGGQQMLGANIFAGKAWRLRHWSMEAALGAGIEAAQILEQDASYALGGYGQGSVTIRQDVTYSVGVYGQGSVGAAVPISRSLEIFLRLGAHLTPVHSEDWFVASTIGLRYTLP